MFRKKFFWKDGIWPLYIYKFFAVLFQTNLRISSNETWYLCLQILVSFHANLIMFTVETCLLNSFLHLSHLFGENRQYPPHFTHKNCPITWERHLALALLKIKWMMWLIIVNKKGIFHTLGTYKHIGLSLGFNPSSKWNTWNRFILLFLYHF